MADFACHPAAILSDGVYPVFVKLSDAADGQRQFEVELAGLAYLTAASGVVTPTALGAFPVPGGSLLVMQALPEVTRSDRHWRQIGQTIGRIHKVKGQQFGFPQNGYFGPLFQDNTPVRNAEFIPQPDIGAEHANVTESYHRNTEDWLLIIPEIRRRPKPPTSARRAIAVFDSTMV